MNKDFSAKWKASKQPRKQRKYRYNAPLHTRGKFLNATLSKALAEKHGERKERIRVGDKVRVMRGKYKGKEGKVEVLNLRKSTIKMTGVEVSKKDGSKAKVPLHASNLMITDLSLDDKKRMEKKTSEKKN